MSKPHAVPQVNAMMAKLTKATTDATALNRGGFEAMTRSAQIWTTGTQEIGQRYRAMIQGMAGTFVASAKAMTSAKSAQEAAVVQAAYLKTVQEQMTGQAAQFGKATATLVQQASAPMAGLAASAVPMMMPGKLAA